MSTVPDRLARVREKMRAAGVTYLLVRSTDRYLNEYVPNDESLRVFISGFTGSMGEVAIGPEKLYLAVDGRYWLQAEKETDPAHVEVLKVPYGTAVDQCLADKLVELVKRHLPERVKIGFDPNQITPAELEQLRKAMVDKQNKGASIADLLPLDPSPVREVFGPERPSTDAGLRALDEAKVGRTVAEKHAALAVELERLGLDALFVQKLDEIAYLTNLRGTELAYQATFKSILLATREGLHLGVEPSVVPAAVRTARPTLTIEAPGRVLERMRGLGKIGFDRANNSEAAKLAIAGQGATPVEVESPVGPMKAKKNPAELEVMLAAFARADDVVSAAQRWLCGRVVKGKRVTEADFAEKVKALFAESGATGLSFKVISAAGKNGAVIHYSDPDPNRAVARGELMLLDTGAYYEEGYATDLTRTFLVDREDQKGSKAQRRFYTLVLKGAIRAMSARLPKGSRGYQLDAICRAPLWAAGLDYAHGTGHGVGVNVHEFPPRVAPGAAAPLEVGHVFSIEPGYYHPDFGGIRIENLCTVVEDDEHPGFLKVKPLTFSPLDARLIDKKLLSADERAWLEGFGKAPGKKRGKRRKRA